MKTCKHNLMILCEDHTKCASCGWNPEVEEVRKAALQKRFTTTKKRGQKNED